MSDSPSKSTKAPPRRSFFRWLFSRRILVRIAFVIVSLVTLAALALAFENWRGARDWERWRTAAEARGEKLDFVSLAPKPVPDGENFAATPLLAALLSYRLEPGTNPIVWLDPAGVERAKAVNISRPPGSMELKSYPELSGWMLSRPVDLQKWAEFYTANTNYPASSAALDAPQTVLLALTKFDGELAELRGAAARPRSVFAIRYEDAPAMLFEHLSVIKSLQTLVTLHGLAAGGAGRTNEAFDDALLGLRLAEALREEPLLLSHMVHLAQHNLALQPVWEGLARRRFSASQLEQLQQELARPDFIASLVNAIRGERAFANNIFDRARLGKVRVSSSDLEDQPDDPAAGMARLPRVVVYRNQLAINRFLGDALLPVLMAHPDFIEIGKVREVFQQIESRRSRPYNIFLTMTAPTYARTSDKALKAQAYRNLAMVACALERHQLAVGAYPDSLAALVPKFIPAIPLDPINGEPLHYRRTDDGRYSVYSICLNLRDDGGKVVANKLGTAITDEGDWVWSYSRP